MRPPMKRRIVPSRLRMKPAIVPATEKRQRCPRFWVADRKRVLKSSEERTHIRGNHIAAVFSIGRACCMLILPANRGFVTNIDRGTDTRQRMDRPGSSGSARASGIIPIMTYTTKHRVAALCFQVYSRRDDQIGFHDRDKEYGPT